MTRHTTTLMLQCSEKQFTFSLNKVINVFVFNLIEEKFHSYFNAVVCYDLWIIYGK